MARRRSPLRPNCPRVPRHDLMPTVCLPPASDREAARKPAREPDHRVPSPGRLQPFRGFASGSPSRRRYPVSAARPAYRSTRPDGQRTSRASTRVEPPRPKCSLRVPRRLVAAAPEPLRRPGDGPPSPSVDLRTRPRRDSRPCLRGGSSRMAPRPCGCGRRPGAGPGRRRAASTRPSLSRSPAARPRPRRGTWNGGPGPTSRRRPAGPARRRARAAPASRRGCPGDSRRRGRWPSSGRAGRRRWRPGTRPRSPGGSGWARPGRPPAVRSAKRPPPRL